MFKKLLSIIVFTLLTVGTYSQTIVNTDPENKKVILEDFTGFKCVYCPSGHAIAQSIKDDNPGNVFLINVHEGSLSVPGSGEPDFRTDYGPALASLSGRTGWPSGNVNRHVFPGRENTPDKTAMYRNFWEVSANETLALSSYVNMAVEATLDVQTREMTIHVETYYTGDSPEATNFLNVALLQNNTLGPQTGGNMGDEYIHQHRLVDFLTGQWGEEISTTTTGSFIDKNYTYTIPADYRNVPVNLADLELVVYMTETHQEVISGNGTFPLYTNFENDNDATVQNVDEIIPQCGSTIAPTTTIQNTGENPLTAVDIEYSVNGGAVETYSWTGNLTSFQTATIQLPEINYTVQATNTVEVSIADDDDNTNNEASTTFDEATLGTGTVTMELYTDDYGDEVRWYLRDVSGTALYSGGPYGANETITETFQLPEVGCYTFDLQDTYGDGGGVTRLTDSDGTRLFITYGNYGSGVKGNFQSNGVLGIGDNDFSGIAIYPNPANDILNIQNAENANIQVFDITGKLLLNKSNISNQEQLNVASFTTGTYFVKIMDGNKVQTQKLLIAR